MTSTTTPEKEVKDMTSTKTPEKIATDFRRAIDCINGEWTEKGTPNPLVKDFLHRAAELTDAMAASNAAVTAETQERVTRLLVQVTMHITTAAGIADAVLSFVADRSKLN